MSRDRRPGSRHRGLALALVFAVASAVGPAAVAQTGDIEQARAEREQIRREQAAVAAELDPLLARDAELEQAVADLDALRVLQEAKLDTTRQAITVAEQALAEANVRIADKQLEIVALRDLARAQAVQAYVRPNGDVVEQVLQADDLTTAARRRALLRSVSTRQADVVDQLRAAEDDLEVARNDVANALAEIEVRKADEESQLAELQLTRGQLEEFRVALAERIADFQTEIDGLNEDEAVLTATLTSLIAEEDARRRAEEDARRRIELERLLAEQTQAPDPQQSTPGADPAPTPVIPPPTQEPPASASGLIWPTSGVVTSPFGPRWGRLHRGIDINAPTGSPIVAAKGGVVVFAGENGGFGLNVIIDHGGGFATVYAHLSQLSVSEGQSVSQGVGVGLSGCTGSCTGAHLHFETRVNGEAQDPMLFLP